MKYEVGGIIDNTAYFLNDAIFVGHAKVHLPHLMQSGCR